MRTLTEEGGARVVGGRAFADHPIKVTALIYIREALGARRYELLPGMIQIAREFGALNEEVWALVKAHLAGGLRVAESGAEGLK
jgi:hypothetical protein